MKKKLYISPEMETIKIKMNNLMIGSLNGEAPAENEGFAPGLSGSGSDEADW